MNKKELLKEIVTEYKQKLADYNPTLEEIKKEWEKLGYKWFEDNYKIELITTIDDFVKEIYLDKINKNYCCFDGGTGEEYSSITIQEHQLLTKTFRALGWI